MPLFASVRAAVPVTATLPPGQQAVAHVEMENGTTLRIDLEVNRRAYLAGIAPAVQVSARVEIDHGAGFAALPAADPAVALNIRESTEDLADTLQFQLVGRKWNPATRAFGRALTPVRVFLGIGAPGARYFEKVFDGHVVQSSFTFDPPVLSVMLLDGAAPHRFKRLKDYSVPADSGRTRLSILTEMLALAEIPTRSISLPGGDGGKVTKPVTPGDAFILEFIRDWLSVCDVEIGFIGGGLYVAPFNVDAAVSGDLYPRDIVRGSMTFTPTQPLSANRIIVAAVKSITIDPNGEETTRELEVTTALYATQAWVEDQLGGLGPGPSAAVIQIVSRIETLTTRRGTLVVRRDQKEEAMYAPGAARLQYAAVFTPGEGWEYATEPLEEAQVFRYPDDSWHAEPRESLRTVRRSIDTATTNAGGWVIARRLANYFWHFVAQAIFGVEAGVSLEDIPRFPLIPILEDGEGLLKYREVIGFDNADPAYNRPDALTDITYEIDADGYIDAEVKTERFYSKGNPKSKTSDMAWVYGVDNRQYRDRPAEFSPELDDPYGGTRVTRSTHRQLGEDDYESVTRVVENGGAPKTTTATGTGARPQTDRIEAETTSQELRAQVDDSTQQALAYVIEEFAHNEYIENRDEAERVAAMVMRAKSAWRFVFTLPLNQQVHKFKWYRVWRPKDGLYGMRLYVQMVERTVGSFVQTVTADYFPVG